MRPEEEVLLEFISCLCEHPRGGDDKASQRRGEQTFSTLSMRTVEVETRTDRTGSLSKGRDRAREEFCSPRARMAWTLGRRGIESRDARLLVHTKYVSTHGEGTWEERVLIKKNSQ